MTNIIFYSYQHFSVTSQCCLQLRSTTSQLLLTLQECPCGLNIGFRSRLPSITLLSSRVLNISGSDMIKYWTGSNRYSIYLVLQMLSSAWRCLKKPAWQFLLSTWRTLLVVLAWSALPENLFPTFPLCQTTKSKKHLFMVIRDFLSEVCVFNFFWTSGIGKFNFRGYYLPALWKIILTPPSER